jgi:SAM-dependent methyltransferase
MTDACPSCDGELDEPFIERLRVPILQNVLYESRRAATEAQRGDLILRACRQCGLVINSAFDSALVDYANGYENTQTHSPHFDQYVDSLVDGLIGRGASGVSVLEVGCGSGYFLRRLVQKGDNTGVGFDTA